MKFVGGAEDGECDGCGDGDPTPRPIGGPNEGESEIDAPSEEGGKMGELIPDFDGGDNVDLGWRHCGEDEDDGGPNGDTEPSEVAKPLG